MKQTAVEWMFEQFFKVKWGSMQGNMPTIFEQAKEMEEGQIALAYSKGTLDGVNKDFTNGYTYYKKTYK
jgi:hypothetical protein